MEIEIEKNFEVENFPAQLTPFEEKTVWQSYILSSKEEEIRIRKQLYNGEYICDLTYKKAHGADTRKKHTVHITVGMYDEMVQGKAQIVKERKFYMSDGYQVMVDYYPQLEIYLAEVEFETDNELNSFIKPSWLGNEVNISNKELIKQLN